MMAMECIKFIVLLTFLLIHHHICHAGLFSSPDDKYASVFKLNDDSKIPPSLSKWSFIHQSKQFAITSMVVDHHSDGSWYIPSLHEKHSIGWNRTTQAGFFARPYACNIRFFGVGLEKTLLGFEEGGTGYLTISKANGKSIQYESNGRNESLKIHCYFLSGKGYGSNFYDNPKTFGLAIYCPITLDQEAGPYIFKAIMEQGFYCRLLAESPAELTVHLRPTSFVPPIDHLSTSEITDSEISSTVETIPAAFRSMKVRSLNGNQPRLHAVCTVQTFRNSQTGPMLYLFSVYYLTMGYSVIIYDRYGFHSEYLKSLVDLPGMYYHPYTVYQLAEPSKYNDEHKKKQSFSNKYYYKMEKNWVKGYGGEKADTADQDMDKTKTYDHSRVEYAFFKSILYADADEFFYCPQAPQSVRSQRRFQQRLMNTFYAQGIEEMRFLRLPYAGLAPPGINNTAEYRATVDLTIRTQTCMEAAFNQSDMTQMFQCWSSASTYDDFPKSSDFASVCPFHYNHWSCDGGRGGGRDWGKTCRCKVAFDMLNFLAYKPILNKCHMIHFNDNKYRFQLQRDQAVKVPKGVKSFDFTHDNGNITDYNPIAYLLMRDPQGASLNTSVAKTTKR